MSKRKVALVAHARIHIEGKRYTRTHGEGEW